jgi:predicted transposase YbfD/YdcC
MNQLSLPYEEIKKVANRNYLRENFKRNSIDSYWIPLNKIQERDGLNSRIIYEGILELADAIISNPETIDPMVLDILPSGIGLVDEGHRRLRAHQLNVERGKYKDDILVEFYPNKSDVTELDRMVRQVTSNLNLKKDLKPFEKAKVAWNVKNLYSKKPKTHEEVAKLLHLSRQTIDNLIRIHEAPDDLRQEMVAADMSITECLNLVVGNDKLKKQSNKAEVDANKNPSAAPQDPKDALANDIKELEALEQETDEERDKRLLREQTKKDQELEQLMEVSDEIKVRPEVLPEYLGRKLSHYVINEFGEIIVNKDQIITEEVIDLILSFDRGESNDTILVYKKGMEPVAKSVVTVLPEGKEKDKYDMSRPEIEKIQRAIQAGDKIDAIVSKLDVPEQTKNDIAYQVHWLIENLMFVRDWVHTNKKQNKAR